MRPRTWFRTRTQQYQTPPISLPSTSTHKHTQCTPRLGQLWRQSCPGSQTLGSCAGGLEGGGRGMRDRGVGVRSTLPAATTTTCQAVQPLSPAQPSTCGGVHRLVTQGLKMLLLGTLLCGFGEQNEEILGLPGALAFPERSAQQEAEWASSRYCREKNHGSLLE